MNTTNILQFSGNNIPLGSGQGSDCPSIPRAKTPRVVITNNQFNTYIGSLTDITSKKLKSISQQTKLNNFMKKLIDDCCKSSNGGATTFGVNQLTYRTDTTFSRDTITRAIKNVNHYQIFIKVCDAHVGQNSTIYMLGDPIMDLLDPIKLNQLEVNRAKPTTKARFTNLGFDINDKAICCCCRKSLFITNFEIDEDPNNLTYIEITPACKKCIYQKISTGIKPNGWNEGWKSHYANKKQRNAKLSIKDVSDSQDRQLDREIDKLLKEN